MRPSKIKNAALTELPIIPPMVLNLSKREDTAAAVAATTIDVIMTILVLDQRGGGYSEIRIPTSNVQGRRRCPRSPVSGRLQVDAESLNR